MGVSPGSSAEKAGLRDGDLITGCNGQRLGSPTTLTTLLLAKKHGQAVRLSRVDQTGTAHGSNVTLGSGRGKG
jgi:putative serine protease PepD